MWEGRNGLVSTVCICFFYDFVTSSIFHVLVPDHPFWSSFHSTNNGERELQEGGEEIPTETRPEGETWRALDHMDIQVEIWIRSTNTLKTKHVIPVLKLTMIATKSTLERATRVRACNYKAGRNLPPVLKTVTSTAQLHIYRHEQLLLSMWLVFYF